MGLADKTAGEPIHEGKRALIMKDGDTLHGYVLAKDPVGNEYFQYEASARLDQRGIASVWAALVEDTKEK